jgi:predicted peroxiredoxin
MARLLFVLLHSTDDPDRAVTGLSTALAAAESGHDVGVWLAGEGVRLGVSGVAETIREPGPRSAAELTEALVERGARLFCSRRCFETREFEKDALRRGAEVAGPERLAALVAEGRTPVSL